MAVLGVKYNEFSKENGLGYKSTYAIYTDNGQSAIKEFDSGDFDNDWRNLNEFVDNLDCPEDEIHLESASVNRFRRDKLLFS